MFPKILQNFATETAIKAGKYLAENQHRVKVVKSKILQDIVTNIDLEAQKIIIDEIKTKFPDHGIYAEENHFKEIKEFTWTIDPIDGTKYYAKGLTCYTTLLALFHRNQPILGVVYSPAEQNTYVGTRDRGVFFNNVPINISKTSELRKSTIYATLPNIGMSKPAFTLTQNGINKLFANCYRVRYSANVSLAMAWVAHGAFEAFVNLPGDENVWDVGAGFGILSAAGGKITDLKGNSIKDFDLTKGIIASNGKIHDQLLALLSV